MNLPAVILPVFLAGSMSSVYFLPSAGEVAQSAVKMDLPDDYGSWQFKKIPPSSAEIQALAKDTEFSKAVCFRARPGEFNEDGYVIPDRIDLSVVLSGTDINNSIHRPERCMPAQGHQNLTSQDKVLELENGRTVTAKRLHSTQRIPTSESGTEFMELNCVTYYFFVGHDTITNDHFGRTLQDMKDRLLMGRDQRWAYVSASMWYGQMPWIEGTIITEQEADQKLSQFTARFAEEQIQWDQVAP